MRDGRSGRLRDAVAAWEDMRSRRLVVFAGSAHGLSTTGIDHRGVDVLRLLLRPVDPTTDMDLLISGPGGNVSAAARAADLVRRSARHLGVLVPHRARSAATLLALAADEIIVGSAGDLGPLDAVMLSAAPGPPTGNVGTLPPTISSRDLANFPRMATEWFGLSSDDAQACFAQLCARVFPINLSQLHRAENHVRWAARNLVPADGSRSPERHQALVEQLVTGYDSHDAAIDSREAAAIGLPARDATPKEEALLDDLWDILDDEFASAVTEPGAAMAVVATRHRTARHVRQPVLAAEPGGPIPLMARWVVEDPPDQAVGSRR